MRQGCLLGAVFVLGAALLLATGRSHGQRTDAPAGRGIIAASVPVTAETQPVLSVPDDGLRPVPNLRPTPASPPAPMMSGEIQQTSFVPDPPPGGTPQRRMTENGLFHESPAPAPAPTTPTTSAAPTPSAPAAAPIVSNPPSTTAALVSVDVVGPARVSLGQPLTCEIVVRNTGCVGVGEVRVEGALPAGVRLLRAEPPGQTQGERVTWDLGTLEAGAEQRLKIEVQLAAEVRELNLRPHVAFRTLTGLRTAIARPPFRIEMTADHNKGIRGGPVTFTIRLFNQGDTLIRNIKLYDPLPEGLSHPAGKIVGIPHLGDLSPGETRSLTLETTAIRAGQFHNEIIAQADGGVEARASADVTVSEPMLSLRVDGPKQALTRRDLDFHLEVANPGPASAVKVRLVQALPSSFEVVAVSTGGQFDPTQHTLTWALADLTPGQRQSVTFKAQASAAGDWPLYTSVQAENIPEARLTNVLHLDGSASLALEVRAGEDSLAVGEETVCEVHVFNQGDAPCAGLRLTAWLPDQVKPLDAQGPVAGDIRQQQAQFSPLAQLPPHGDAVYRLRLRGERPGTGQVRVELTADRERPVENATSIQVSGAPASTGNAKPQAAGELR